MKRDEFKVLRGLPDKTIEGDIEFSQHKRIGSNFTAEYVKIENDLGYDLVLYGTYKPDFPAITFNFVVNSRPVCRYDINGTVHGDAGRTHKHSLQDESCPALNLPTARKRVEFDLNTYSVQEVWEMICKEANLVHNGVLVFK